MFTSRPRQQPLAALVVKGQSILVRTWTLRSDNAVEPAHHQSRTKRGSRANCQRWEALVCIDHLQEWWPRGPKVKITRCCG